MVSKILPLWTGLAAVVICSIAWAVDADELVRQGLELRRAGRDAEALARFQEAYDVAKTPRNAAQVGLCLQALGRWSEADPFLSEALSATSNPWVIKNRETLKESLESVKSRVGRIEVLGEPAGARVDVNGRNVGSLPLREAILVNEGSADILVSAPGYDDATRTVQVTGNSYQRVVMRLQMKASPAALPAIDTTAVPEEPRSLLANPWTWLATAVVVGLAVSAVLVFGGSDPRDPPYTHGGVFE